MTAARTLGLSSEAVTPEVLPYFTAVGMVPGEYVLRRERAYISTGRAQASLCSYLDAVAAAFAPAPVWYRVTDLDAAEAAVLDGYDDDEIRDPIRLLGTRGVRRAMRCPGAFDLEMGLVAAVQSRRPNLGVLLPFVTEPAEVTWAVDRASRSGVAGPFAMMAEIPAAIVTLAEFADLGLRHVVIGCNDLWSLTLGSVRGSTGYDALAPAMVRMLEFARSATSAAGLTLAMGGYLSLAHLEIADRLGFEEVVVHYRDAPRLLGLPHAAFPDRDVVSEVKAWTRAAIEARGHRFEAFVLPRNRHRSES